MTRYCWSHPSETVKRQAIVTRFAGKRGVYCLLASESVKHAKIIPLDGETGSVMRVAAIYDIHANLPALEAVLEDIRQAKVDQIVVGGDVLPGPMPRETIACLLALDIPVQFIHGNGDREVLAQMRGEESEWYRSAREQWREPVRWSAEQLRPEDEELLAAWPEKFRIKIPGLCEVLFCHATPRNDTEIFTRLTPEERLLPVFEKLDVAVVVCGHTHMQFDRTVGAIRVLNAGSVGMPFGEPGAYWLLLGPNVELRHTRYDLAKAAERIRETKYPQAEDFAARNVLQPPSEEKTLEALARAELR
jgi:putative phosphoesterase